MYKVNTNQSWECHALWLTICQDTGYCWDESRLMSATTTTMTTTTTTTTTATMATTTQDIAYCSDEGHLMSATTTTVGCSIEDNDDHTEWHVETVNVSWTCEFSAGWTVQCMQHSCGSRLNKYQRRRLLLLLLHRHHYYSGLEVKQYRPAWHTGPSLPAWKACHQFFCVTVTK